ncbi:MAG: helix-turn-helix transcriptional regulator [Chloroflexi bacterium]|nr:helix-turn-helix transcriptional regulator [Chloroflexota bacterium]
MKLYERLAALRRDQGLTLRELRERIAEHTGERMSISYLSELERTDSFPSVETLARMARAYDLSLQQLVEPVEFGPEASIVADRAVSYPEGLLALHRQGRIDDDWLASLNKIEFRGKRPEAEDEWLAVYAVLKALIEPKLRR